MRQLAQIVFLLDIEYEVTQQLEDEGVAKAA